MAQQLALNRNLSALCPADCERERPERALPQGLTLGACVGILSMPHDACCMPHVSCPPCLVLLSPKPGPFWDLVWGACGHHFHPHD